MSEWNEYKLNELADVVMGQSPPSSSYNTDNIGLPFLQGCADFGVVYPEAKFFCTEPKKIAPANSILISVRAPVGLTNLSHRTFVIGRGLAALIPKNSDLNFLFYSINHNTLKLDIVSQGSTFSAINSDELNNFKLFAPLIQEQRKIARILSTIDSVIEKTQSAIDKYKAIKQGMLHDLFTRGIDIKTGKLRPKYEDAPELYKPSKLGWIPVEWNIDIIEKCGEIVTGSTPSTIRSDYYGDEFLFVSPSDIQEGIFISNTEKRLTRKGFDICRQLPERTICAVCIGSTIGKIALLIKEGCTNQQINSVICFNRELSFYYFYAMLYYNEKQFRKETGLQAVPIVNKHNFSKFVLPIIEKNEAIEISSRLKTIDNKLHIEQISLYKLQMLKSGLMSDLLSGKKPVKVNDEDLLKTA